MEYNKITIFYLDLMIKSISSLALAGLLVMIPFYLPFILQL